MLGVQPWGSVPWTANRVLDPSILAEAVEAATAAESSDRLAGVMNRVQAETVTAVSTQAVIPQTARVEQAAAVDAASVFRMYAWRFMEEPTTATDTETVTMIVARAEPMTATETQNRAATLIGVRDETVTATETQNRVAGMSRAQSEPATAIDTVTGVMNPNVSLHEYIPTKLVPGSYPLTANDLLTFDRNSVASYIDGSGTRQTAASDVPRIQGGQLLIEAAATNVVRNNSMTGAASGTPGVLPTSWGGSLGTISGVAVRVSAVSSENGIPYIDLEFSGTASTNFSLFYTLEDLQRQAAQLGETWTSSIYTKRVSGSIPGTQPTLTTSGRTIGNLDNDNTVVNLNTGTGALSGQRVSATRTIASAGTVSVGPYLTFTFASGTLYLFTMRIAGPQLELGADATSLIQTTNANVTRLADDAWPLPQNTQDRSLDVVLVRDETGTAVDTQNAVHVVDQTDTGSAVDTESVSALLEWADVVSPTDTSDKVVLIGVSRDEVDVLTEQQSVSATMQADRFDTTPIADDAVVVLIAEVAVTEIEAATADQEIAQVGMAAERSETVTLTDTIAATSILPVERDEVESPTDTTNRSMDASATQADDATATDEQVPTMAAARSIEETATVTDTRDGGIVVFADALDVIGVTDTSTRTLVTPVNEAEPANATSTQEKTINVPVERTDTVTPTETQDADAFYGAGRTDNETLTDTASQDTAQSATRTESSPAQDINVGNTLADVERHEAETVTDTSNRITGLNRQQDEPAQAVDVPSTTSLNTVHETAVPTDQYFKHMLAETNVEESATPTHTQSVASLFNRWLQEDTVAIDTQSVLAFMQALQVDEATALDRPEVADFTVGVSVQEVAVPTDTVNGVVVKITDVLEQANAVDVQTAAVTMIRMVQELNPALDLAAAVAHAQVVVAEGADATDWCAIVIPVGQHDGTDATDTCAVFLYNTNRMLLLFDKDCHC
jgi:hypothetical protein